VPEIVGCEGAPRDLGVDQGRACGARLRANFADESPLMRLRHRLGRADAGGAALHRDLRRHFPQQAELLDGLSHAARVPLSWLIDVLRDDLSTGPTDAAIALAAGAARTGAGALLARAARPGDVVRRSRPEAGFRSVEIAQPFSSCAVAGVNEKGLGVALGTAAADGAGDCAAPAALLLQDVLQRFADLDGALGHCLSRPGGGRATLLIADASGDVAGVAFAGDERRVLRPVDGLLVEPGDGGGETAKRLRDATALDAERLAALLPRTWIAIDPANGCLQIPENGDAATRISL
jgi:hypothetical protein